MRVPLFARIVCRLFARTRARCARTERTRSPGHARLPIPAPPGWRWHRARPRFRTGRPCRRRRTTTRISDGQDPPSGQHRRPLLGSARPAGLRPTAGPDPPTGCGLLRGLATVPSRGRVVGGLRTRPAHRGGISGGRAPSALNSAVGPDSAWQPIRAWRDTTRRCRGQRPAGATTGAGPARPTRIATLSVDCGDVAPPFRMIVRGLTTNGWTVRGGQRYRLMTLHYVLLPPIGTAARKGQPITPVLYTAAITCVPDVTAPWADSDGRHRQHSVGSRPYCRQPRPLAGGGLRTRHRLPAQRAAPGRRRVRRRHPAGVLRVNISQSTATWRPVPADRPRETVNARSPGRTGVNGSPAERV